MLWFFFGIAVFFLYVIVKTDSNLSQEAQLLASFKKK